MRVSQRFRVEAPADAVARALAAEGFNVERERDREGVVSTEYVVTREQDDAIEFELRSVEYRRRKTGGLDRSATTATLTRNRFDRRERVLTWSYHGEAGDRMRLGGVYRITPDGADASEIAHDIDVEVRVPVIGGQIAKLVARDLDRPRSYYAALLAKHMR